MNESRTNNKLFDYSSIAWYWLLLVNFLFTIGFFAEYAYPGNLHVSTTSTLHKLLFNKTIRQVHPNAAEYQLTKGGQLTRGNYIEKIDSSGPNFLQYVVPYINRGTWDKEPTLAAERAILNVQITRPILSRDFYNDQER